jgi:hypothetical protein
MARDRQHWAPGRGVRWPAPAALAGSGIVIATAAAAMRGWVWALAAWFGSSLVTFAIATATANRRALAAEEEERRLLRSEAGDQQ